MAEQVPYGMATSLINTLASLAFKEIASIYGVKSEIEWLKETVEDIKAVLSDADQKQNTDQLIQRWISKLKRVLYEADDLLDEIHTQHLLRQRDSKGKGKEKVREFFSSSNPLAFRLKIAGKIRKIRRRLNDVAGNMSKLNLDRRVVVEMKYDKKNWRQTCSFVLQEDIIGREESEKEVVDLLLDNSNNENVSLVAIVGIGGLGKTALAQLVYNKADMEPLNFNKRMWVCVSEDFDVTTLVKKILESLLGKKVDDNQQLDMLQKGLRQNLEGQRYLLVLDDVWNGDREKWLNLKKYLLCGAQGSKILVTTRDQTVANMMDVKTPYVLRGLTNDQSWALLKKMASLDQDELTNRNLESIGKKIAKKCAGVPLAIRAMGSLLQSRSKERDWEAILEGEFWKLYARDKSIMPILKLSYDSLAFELKQCFAYCSLYPKDWRYQKDELIYLWMAQGFLEDKEKNLCPEDVGEEYVQLLLMKSFLQDVETDGLGEIKYFKMHDLMHDLSQSIPNSDYCMHADVRRSVTMGPIYASFEEYNSDSSLNMLDPSTLRTFLTMKKEGEMKSHDLLAFKRLRNLDLYQIRKLPKSIGKMSQLRYLNLSYHYLTCLPKSISNLVNLQTLILYYCRNLEFSVDIITKLINLRRLDITFCKAFDDGMPIGLGGMTTLQSLSHFIVGKDDKERKKAKLNELNELNLRGSLTIHNLDVISDVEEESKDVNLKTKQNLISLTLDWGRNISTVDWGLSFPTMENSDAMRLLDNLCPHKNLKALEILCYPGVCISDWLLSCTNLVELKLNAVRNLKYLPALEGFVSLKTLHMWRMDKLEYIYYKGCSSSTSFFPSLEELEIRGCGGLRGWLREENVPNTIDNEWHHHSSLPPFSRLSYLIIKDCRNLSCMPTFPIVRGLLLIRSSMEPLLKTLKASTSGPSTSCDMSISLSKLKSLEIEGIDIEALPGEWMQNLSFLKHLSIKGFSSLEKLFCHMKYLSATLEELTIGNIKAWSGDENYNIECQHLCCLHSLRKIQFSSCNLLKVLPEWICNLQSLQSIHICYCPNLESFPQGMCHLTNLQTLVLYDTPLLERRCEKKTGEEWPKIAHIPNISIDGYQISLFL